MRYWIRVQNGEEKLVTFESLRSLPDDHLVRRDGETGWVPVGEILEKADSSRVAALTERDIAELDEKHGRRMGRIKPPALKLLSEGVWQAGSVVEAIWKPIAVAVKIVGAVFVVGLILCLLGGALGLVGWQVREYLRTGLWPSRSILWALENYKVVDPNWPTDPQSWKGALKLAGEIPLSLFLFVVAAFIVAWVLDDRSSKKPGA